MGEDLISRSSLMKRVLQEEYDNDIHIDNRAKAIHHGEYQHFYKAISEQPTIFDLESAIEKIEGIEISDTCMDCKYKNKCDELEELHGSKLDLCGLTVKHLVMEILKSAANATNGKNGG